MQVIVRRQDEGHCARVTGMVREPADKEPAAQFDSSLWAGVRGCRNLSWPAVVCGARWPVPMTALHTCQVLAGGQAHWRADHAGQDGGS